MSCDHLKGYGALEFNWCPNCGEPLTEDAKDSLKPLPNTDGKWLLELELFRTRVEQAASYMESALEPLSRPVLRHKEPDVADFEALKKSAERRSKWKWWWPGSPTG